MNWFEVDKAGLASILERRGKSFAVFELLSNAWDSGATKVCVMLEPIAGEPYAKLSVDDNSPEGWADIDDAFKMFGTSRRAADPTRRGRFSLGEKLVLAICRSAKISTMNGALVFNERGRRFKAEARPAGTRFECEIRMTREELEKVFNDLGQIIPPRGCETFLDQTKVRRDEPIKVIRAKLPTEFRQDDALRRTIREADIEIYNAPGPILEMGIPVCAADWPWMTNVMQKVPLNMERDSITDAFRSALRAAVTNAMHENLSDSEASEPWAAAALADPRVNAAAVKSLVTKRFGDRAVIATPGDPIANANAEAQGYSVIHGGSMSADAWANVRKHDALIPSSTVFPTAAPAVKAAGNPPPGTCPACGQPVK